MNTPFVPELLAPPKHETFARAMLGCILAILIKVVVELVESRLAKSCMPTWCPGKF